MSEGPAGSRGARVSAPRAVRLRRLGDAQLVAKCGRTRHYHLPEAVAPTPDTWTRIDREYETLRLGVQTLLHHLGILTPLATEPGSTAPIRELHRLP